MKNNDATANNNDATTDALEQVDVRRRKFLGKLLTGGAAVAALPVMSTILLGEEGEGGGIGKGGKGKGGKGKGGKGKGQFAARRAKMLIEKFDKDGDGALNLDELTNAISAAMSRGGKGKGQGGKGKGGKGKGKGGKGKGQGGKGKGQGGKGKGKGKGGGGKGKGQS